MRLTSALAFATSILAVSGTSTHNWWKIPSGFGDIAEIESSIRVPEGSDPTTTYWMANGWGGGYMGMQHNTPTTRTILFSAWDDGNGGSVWEVERGQDVIVEAFGGEGTGGHAKYLYNWTAGETVYFSVRANVNAKNGTADYTGWWRPSTQTKWNLVATLRVENKTNWLTGIYGFLENFGNNDNEIREGYWGNFTIVNTNGKRYNPTGVSYTHTTPQAGSHYEYKFVNGESYMRTDGPADQGIYPPTNPK
ncbi:hypothetical protein BC941DRAFT_478124 [Chlamydoabsidia padenii]|nr:hypothetical protein BC941DRAFT_478124 [Chlamydoabsidia padenii]